MPSISFRYWCSARATSLDRVELAYTAVSGTDAGRRHATQQLNHAYVVLLAGEFQGFCRDLYNEAVEAILPSIPPVLQKIVATEFDLHRTLARGNATPSNLGTDFARFDLELWPAVDAVDARGPALRRQLEQMNQWRNAIAHSDFNAARLGGRITVTAKTVRRWRRVCNRVARLIDRALCDRLGTVLGTCPWP